MEMISVVVFGDVYKVYIMHTLKDSLGIDGATDIMFDDEVGLVTGFFDLVGKEDPTVLTGFNVYGFDLHYLVSRIRLRLIEIPDVSRGVPGSIDLNSIPESMIERIEVLQGGASSIYGSDAISGVINIITRRQQNGFVASAQVGRVVRAHAPNGTGRGRGRPGALVRWRRPDERARGSARRSVRGAPRRALCVGCSGCSAVMDHRSGLSSR